MPNMPLAHISWSVTDNTERKACDAFFKDVFGAETIHEILLDAEYAAMGFDREESLMLVGDTMLIPIAPAGPGALPGSPIGDMLRRSAGPDRWLGLALKVADIAEADAWFRARGFKLHYDKGAESQYFLISRGQVLGLRLELLRQDLPGDPRGKPGWSPARWSDGHPLGIESLQAIGVSVPSLAEAHALFADRLELPELGSRYLPEADADCLAFHLGDTVIEAMQDRSPDGPVARHSREVKGICSLTFRVRNAAAAARYLQSKGLELVGETDQRFAIAPAQACYRTIRFTDRDVPGYPQPGTRMAQPAVFPAG